MVECLPRSGYGMIMVRASEMDDIPEEEPDPVEVEGKDFLLADEVNRGFTDLLEEHRSGRNWDAYTKYFDILRFFQNSRHHIESSIHGSGDTGTKIVGSEIADAKWYVDEDPKTSSVYDYYKATRHVNVADPNGYSHLYWDQVGNNKYWGLFKDNSPTATSTKTFNYCMHVGSAGSGYSFASASGDQWQKVYPGYGFGYSRPMFQENRLMTSYKTSAGARTYSADVLDIESDVRESTDRSNERVEDLNPTNHTDGVHIVDGKEAGSSVGGIEKFKFQMKYTENWYVNYYKRHKVWNDPDDHSKGDHWSSWSFDHTERKSEEHKSPATISYDTTHSMYTYTPSDRPTAHTDDKGAQYIDRKDVHEGGIDHHSAAYVTNLNDTMSVVPEVKYRLHTPMMSCTSGTCNSGLAADSYQKVYMMGAKARTVHPLSVHGFKMTNTSGVRGMVETPEASVGTEQSDLAVDFGSTDSNPLAVVAQGTDFSLTLLQDTLPRIQVTSFHLDVAEKDDISTNGGDACKPATWEETVTATHGTSTAKNTWANRLVDMDGKIGWQSAAGGYGSHMSFVSDIFNHLGVEVTAKRFDKAHKSSDKDTFGQPYKMAKSEGDNIIGPTSHKKFYIRWNNGVIEGKDDVINAIKSAYDTDKACHDGSTGTKSAEEIFAQFEDEFKQMFETNALGDSHNKSGNVGKGSVKSDNLWYNEECDTMQISMWTTTITPGNLMLSDKTDFGSSISQGIGMTESQMRSLGNKGVLVKFYYSMYFDRLEDETASEQGGKADYAGMGYDVSNTGIIWSDDGECHFDYDEDEVFSYGDEHSSHDFERFYFINQMKVHGIEWSPTETRPCEFIISNDTTNTWRR